MNLIPKYPTLTSLYEHYTSPHRTIIFEDRKYMFVRIIRLNDLSQHIYRNDEEQHTLFIHMRNNKPFYVNAVYSVKGVS